jgi:hypothetical protein
MSTTTAQEIYRTWVCALPITERLRLATLILNDAVPALTVDEDDTWSEQDLHDLTTFAVQHALSASRDGDACD